jgi:hypothetical protein
MLFVFLPRASCGRWPSERLKDEKKYYDDSYRTSFIRYTNSHFRFIYYLPWTTIVCSSIVLFLYDFERLYALGLRSTIGIQLANGCADSLHD